jgi:hypothetical protein
VDGNNPLPLLIWAGSHQASWDFFPAARGWRQGGFLALFAFPVLPQGPPRNHALGWTEEGLFRLQRARLAAIYKRAQAPASASPVRYTLPQVSRWQCRRASAPRTAATEPSSTRFGACQGQRSSRTTVRSRPRLCPPCRGRPVGVPAGDSTDGDRPQRPARRRRGSSSWRTS